MRAEVMKYRRLIGKREGWDAALALAAERREQAAAKAAEAKAAAETTAQDGANA